MENITPNTGNTTEDRRELCASCLTITTDAGWAPDTGYLCPPCEMKFYTALEQAFPERVAA